MKGIENIMKEKISDIISEFYGDVYYNIDFFEYKCILTIYNRGLKGMYKLEEYEYKDHIQDVISIGFQVNSRENDVIDHIEAELENILYGRIDKIFEVAFRYADYNSIMIYPYGTSKEEIDNDYEEWKQRQIDDIDEGWGFIGRQKRGMIKRG